jgi:outer membrane protein OmpA-like peptidoglycan-associated protein
MSFIVENRFLWSVLVIFYLSLPATAQPTGFTALMGEIQSRWPERRPVLSADGKTAAFMRIGHPENIGVKNDADIWISSLQPDGQWSLPVNPGFPLNSQAYEEPVAFTADMSAIYLAMRPSADQPPVLGRCIRFGIGWSAPELVPVSPLKPLDTLRRFSISADGSMLLSIVSHVGKRQLLAAQVQENGGFGPWQRWQVEPSEVAEIQSMALAADGRTLYIVASSSRAVETGLYRVVASETSPIKWSEPEPIFALPDSVVRKADLSLSTDGSTMYFSYGLGQTDLYSWTIPPPFRAVGSVRRFSICARDKGQDVKQASLSIYNLQGDEATIRQTTGRVGCAQVLMPENAELLAFGTASGYYLPVVFWRTQQLKSQAPDAITTLSQASGSAAGYKQQLIDMDTAIYRLDIKRKEFRFMPLPGLPDSPKPPPPGGELVALRDLFVHYTQKVEGPPVDVSAKPLKPDTTETMRLAAKFAGHHGQEVQPRETLTASASTTYNADDPDRWQKLYQDYHGVAPLQKKEIPSPPPANPAADSAKVWVQTEMEQIWQNELKAEMWHQMYRDIADKYTGSLSPADRLRVPQAIDSVSAAIAQKAFPKAKDETPSYDAALRAEIHEGAKAYLKKNMEQRAKAELEIELEYQMLRIAREHLLYQMANPSKPGIAAPPSPIAMPTLQRQNMGLSAPTWSEASIVIPAFPITNGTVLTLPGIVFHTDADQFISFSQIELDRLATYLVDHPEWSIEIVSHTHTQLPASQAMPLSASRSRKVLLRLVELGVSADRMRSIGLGGTRPIEREHTFSDMLQNERIEIRFREIPK